MPKHLFRPDPEKESFLWRLNERILHLKGHAMVTLPAVAILGYVIYNIVTRGMDAFAEELNTVITELSK
jgi:hypothetical protein